MRRNTLRLLRSAPPMLVGCFNRKKVIMRLRSSDYNAYLASPASVQEFWQSIRAGEYAVPTFAAGTKIKIKGVSYITETPLSNVTDRILYKVRIVNTTEIRVLKILFVPRTYPDVPAEGKRVNIQQQIDNVAQLKHPNLIAVHEVGEGFEIVDSETEHSHVCPDAYIVMACADGPDLSQLLERHRFEVPIKEALTIMAAVTNVLMYLHNMNLLYRDLKLSNCIYTKKQQLKLIDLCSIAWTAGCKKVFSSTRYYQAPEIQAAYDNNQTPYPFTVESDIFSLGSLFLHLLSKDMLVKYSEDGVKMALRMQRKKNRNLVVCIQRMIIAMINPQPEERLPLAKVNKRLNSYLARLN